MPIVEALGGVVWFNAYAGVLVGSLSVIALSTTVISLILLTLFVRSRKK